MRTTIDDITEVNSLGSAEPIAAPSHVFTGGDTAYAVLYAAFRQPIADGREPHGIFLKLEEGTDIDDVLPSDAEVVRSAADDDDTALLAKGLGYSVLVSTSGPVAMVSAVTREQVKAVAAGLRERSKEQATVTAPLAEPWVVGQYL